MFEPSLSRLRSSVSVVEPAGDPTDCPPDVFSDRLNELLRLVGELGASQAPASIQRELPEAQAAVELEHLRLVREAEEALQAQRNRYTASVQEHRREARMLRESLINAEDEISRLRLEVSRQAELLTPTESWLRPSGGSRLVTDRSPLEFVQILMNEEIISAWMSS